MAKSNKKKEPKFTEQEVRIHKLEKNYPSAYALWKQASDAAYTAQNGPSIALLVAVGALLYFSETVEWIKQYQYPIVIVAIIIMVGVHWFAAKWRLQQVWRCPHCQAPLPVHKAVDKGDTKWVPDETIVVCPHCQKKL